MTRAIAVVVVALSMALAPAMADAKSVRCDGDTYGGVNSSAFPSVHDLRAVNLPRRTYGYAPRCLVAESAAGLIQARFADDGKFPRKVHPQGARWTAGIYRCRYSDLYAEDGDYVVGSRAVCHKTGKPRRRVTMDLGS